MLVLDTLSQDKKLIGMMFNLLEVNAQNDPGIDKESYDKIKEMFEEDNKLHVMSTSVGLILFFRDIIKTVGPTKQRCNVMMCIDFDNMDNIDSSLDSIFLKYNIEMSMVSDVNRLYSAISFISEFSTLKDWEYEEDYQEEFLDEEELEDMYSDDDVSSFLSATFADKNELEDEEE